MSQYTRPTAGPTTSSNHVPPVVYRVLVTNISHTPSSTGNAMTTLKVQILSPASVVGKDGQTYDTAGKEGQLRIAFSEKNLKNCFDTLAALEVPLPPQASTFEDDIAAIQQSLEKRLTGGQTFEMVVTSRKDAVRGPNNEVLKDSLGREIVGREQPDFNMFNICGLVKNVSELGASAGPQRPY